MLNRQVNANAMIRALEVAAATGDFLHTDNLSGLEGLKTPPRVHLRLGLALKPSWRIIQGMGLAVVLQPSSDPGPS
jgi:hypothetical protein